MVNQFIKEYRVQNTLVSIAVSGLTQKTWAVSTSFTADDDYVIGSDGIKYRALDSHTATADDEPGVGVNQADHWVIIVESNSHYYTEQDTSNFDHWITDNASPPNIRQGARAPLAEVLAALGLTNITVSSDPPSGGSNGDLWFQVPPS